MSFEAIRTLLEASGYEIRFREDQWAECLLVREGETWLGRGLDRGAALESALKQACPSGLAQDLLTDALMRSVADHEVTQPNDMMAVERGTRGSLSALIDAGPTPAPARVPSVPRSASRAPTPRERSGPPQLARPGHQPQQASLERSLEELKVLMDRVRDSKEELGMASPERQRLVILAWICEARAHTELFPESVQIRDEVAAISRQLTEIGKSFWPGSVTALQLQMQPRDLPRHLLGGVATTWTRASELAERSLASLEYADERKGYDAYGWADHSMLLPAPADPERAVVELHRAIEAMSGPLDRSAEPRDAHLRPDTDTYLRWIRQLRWLRAACLAPDMWARVAGRLRWWAGRRDPQLTSAARELDSSYTPRHPWAHELGEAAGVVATGNGQVAMDLDVMPSELRERISGRLSEKRVVFVSQRRDPGLQARLEAAFPAASFEWRVTEPRRLRALGEEIEEGKYDTVLAALGFQAREADHLLARACRPSNALYLRVNRGRPIACFRALARCADTAAL